MVEITPELKKKLLNYTRTAINKDQSVEKLIKKLSDFAVILAKDEIKNRENQKCKVNYQSNSPELFVWSLGLMCEYWLLFLYKQKAIDGHCYCHTKPCPDSIEFHEKLLDEAKKSFIEIAQQDFQHDIEKEKSG